MQTRNKHMTAIYISHDNAHYVRMIAHAIGMSNSAFIDGIISTYRAEHPETYRQATERIREVQNELEGGK